MSRSPSGRKIIIISTEPEVKTKVKYSTEAELHFRGNCIK